MIIKKTQIYIYIKKVGVNLRLRCRILQEAGNKRKEEDKGRRPLECLQLSPLNPWLKNNVESLIAIDSNLSL